MKVHELRQLSVTELHSRLGDEKKAIQKLRFSKATTGQVENPSQFRAHRREIARINTIITEQSRQQEGN